jgi:hypothetical protein
MLLKSVSWPTGIFGIRTRKDFEMARPLTAEDVEAISQEAWDATMATGNVLWAELGADTKSRYRDIAIDACRFGGASGEYELKCQELWLVKQEEDPAAPPDPEVLAASADEPVSVLPEGTELTPGNLAKAIRALEGLEEEDEAAPAAKVKKSKKPAADSWAQA